MLSKIDVFYVFILSILRRSPRRGIGLKLPNFGLGAPPTRSCPSSLHFFPPIARPGTPVSPILSTLMRHVRRTYVTLLTAIYYAKPTIVTGLM
jgi:hypothetical protein